MAFMDPAESSHLKDEMTNDASQLGRLYKSKNTNFQVRNVEHNLVESMLEDGWEEYGIPLKTKTKLRKLKSHNVQFEDDIWCQLYRLGYRHLSIGSNFCLPYGKTPEEKKQIDVVAVNDDCILLIECKSSQKSSKAPPYKTEFEGLKRRLDGFAKAVEQVFGKGRRLKYIFATRNLRLNRESADIKRLIETGSYFYNDNTYEYVDGLIKAYKDAAHYQFMAMIFKGRLINRDKIEVPALEGKMGGKAYYMFSLEPHLLLKMGFVLHRTRANEAEMPTYQRLLVPNRLKGIGKFIDDGGFFPNSIVLNFSEAENKLVFYGNSKKSDTRSRSGTLQIPNAYAIAYIIDGQHRVYGYAASGYKESNTIPVVAFCGLTSSEQLELFMDINENQKAVSPTLRITLEEDLFWNSERTDSRIKALRSSIIRQLSGDVTGPLYGKISLGEDKALLSANPFAKVLVRCGLLPQAKGNSYVQATVAASLYDTGNLEHGEEMKRARDRTVNFLNHCYQFVEDCCAEDEELAETFVLSNRGTFAFISLIGSLNSFETEHGVLSIKSSSEDRFDAIRKYLHVLFEGLRNLSNDEEERILGKLGSGAENTWFRFFQEIVNRQYSKYEPADLLDWKERQDQELQDTGRSLGTNIERHLKKTVISKLKELYGDDWDIEIGSIQRDCENRAKEQMEKNYKEGLGRQEIPWTDQFFVTDYKKIIEKYWTKRPVNDDQGFLSFSEIFSIDVGMGFNSKADKVKWLSVFNSYRNLWAHEGTKEKGLNHEEVMFLEKIHGFFDL